MTETRLPGRIEQRPVRWLALLGVVVLLGLLAVLVWGSQRYGGVDGLVQRVKLEFAQPVEHPDLVPTPLAAAASGSAAMALLAEPSTPTPTATVAPPTATPIPADTPLLEAAAPETLRGEHEDTRPTSTPTDTPLPTDTPAPTPQVAPGAGVVLTGLAHYWQTWNNCGPATVSMNLSYYGSQVKQAEAAKFLKPDSDDKNVSPHELAAFARSQGFHAINRIDGDTEQLRQFINAGIPVLIETWLDHDGGMGHYRLVTGYDDST
ncbi:MAG: C39 family peptidase, partial [Anaerolineae bacterium]|nr:C39 family peptidase [Anaerolineae bacterium]